MVEGPYFSDLASKLESAAVVVYRPHHIPPDAVS